MSSSPVSMVQIGLSSPVRHREHPNSIKYAALLQSCLDRGCNQPSVKVSSGITEIYNTLCVIDSLYYCFMNVERDVV